MADIPIKPTKGFDTVLMIGYDKSNSNDIPVLVVGTKIGRGIDILNVITGEEAIELYTRLITRKTIGTGSILKDGMGAAHIIVDEMVVPDDITYRGEE